MSEEGAATDVESRRSKEHGRSTMEDALLETSNAGFTIFAYMKDEIFKLVIVVICILTVCAMCAIMGVSVAGCVLVAFVIALSAATSFIISFIRRHRFYQELCKATESVSEAYLIPEMIYDPNFIEGRISFNAITKMGTLAGIEQASDKQAIDDYRSYIELWIHEVKAPLAACRLILARLHGEDADKLQFEIERISSSIDQALYYARTTSLSDDYNLCEAQLKDVIGDACKKCTRMLIDSSVSVSIEVSEGAQVITDPQWLTFIIAQIITNSAKYGATRITFDSFVVDRGTPHEHSVLKIEDDGWGIPASDISNIFKRGFSGKNGRREKASTGMGLYLVSEMANKMGLGVEVRSAEGKGTSTLISFPHDRRRKGFLALN